MLDPNSKSTPKSFWQRPEGKTGTIFLIAILAGLGYFIFINLGTILAMAFTAVQLVIIGLVLAALLYVVFDKNARTLIWYMYKSFMRWITGIFVQIDPIRILESYIDYLYKNLKEMNTHIAKLKGQVQQLERIIAGNKKEMEESLRMAEQAKQKGNMELVAINTRQFGRLKESNARYQALLNKMQILYRVLAKIHKNSGYLIKDTENEVRMRKQEYKAIKAGHSAMRSAMNIISGDPDKKLMFDMATEAVVQDVSNKIGEMERFIEISGSFIDSVDLQNGMYEQEGLELLEKMEREGVSFLLGDNKIPELDKQENVTVDKDLGNISSYSNLFD